jgi:hypothetical protein
MSDTTDDARIKALEDQIITLTILGGRVNSLERREKDITVQMNRAMDLINMVAATLKIYGMEINALKHPRGPTGDGELTPNRVAGGTVPTTVGAALQTVPTGGQPTAG